MMPAEPRVKAKPAPCQLGRAGTRRCPAVHGRTHGRGCGSAAGFSRPMAAWAPCLVEAVRFGAGVRRAQQPCRRRSYRISDCSSFSASQTLISDW